MKAIFERKPSDFDLRSFEVSKTIRLPAEVFEAVLQKPMRDYDFIQENIEQMHCVCSSSKNVSKRSPKRLAPWST